MVRDTLSVDADARIYVSNARYNERGDLVDPWFDVETCHCATLEMVRGRCQCPECGTVYAISERRAVRRWKSFTSWAV